jgi:hypothetical protein
VGVVPGRGVADGWGVPLAAGVSVPETVVKPGTGVCVGRAPAGGVELPLPAAGVMREGPLPGVVVPVVVFPGVC